MIEFDIIPDFPYNAFLCIQNGFALYSSWKTCTQRKKHVYCVLLCHNLYQPQNIYTSKCIVMMETQITEFTTSFYIPEIKISYLMCHMFVLFWITTTATHAVKYFTIMDHFKMSFVIVIMQSNWLQLFHTKYNLNTMTAIYMCLLKSFH